MTAHSGIDGVTGRRAANQLLPPLDRRVVILVNPADDTGFRERVERAQATGAATPESLEAILRTESPSVVVRRRELEGEPLDVWYVYRDGHWIPG